MTQPLSRSESYVLPVVLAVLVHALLFSCFFVAWQTHPEVVVDAKPTMMAKLYELESKSPAKTETTEKTAGEGKQTKAPLSKEDQMATQKLEQQRIAAEKAAKQKAEAEALAKKQAADKAKADALAKKKAEEKAKADALAKKQADEKAKANAAARKADEDKQAQALADLLGDKVEHAATKGDQESDKIAGNLDQLLAMLIKNNWMELGNPAAGTQVELLIEMLPDGTITQVTVSRSSGNNAFDASAVTAARNVGRVPEVQKLNREAFDKLYRKRLIIFQPNG